MGLCEKASLAPDGMPPDLSIDRSIEGWLIRLNVVVALREIFDLLIQFNWPSDCLKAEK